jgi:hypothetical protein
MNIKESGVIEDRTPKITVEIDTWNWDTGKKVRVYDITKQVIRYQFQKTIKSTGGSCTVVITPIVESDNAMNLFNTMDVVRIKEYDITKFIGIIQTINYTATASNDGKVTTGINIGAIGISSILSSASIGLQMGALLDEFDALVTAINELQVNLGKILDGLNTPTYADIVKVLFENFFGVVDKLGVTGYRNFINTYFDLTTALESVYSPTLPRTYTPYSGTDENINLWDILSQFIEAPLMEMWCDCGKRSVNINGKNITLADGKMYLILRSTPYNDTAYGDKSTTAFDDLPEYKIPASVGTQLSIGRSASEAYSTFTAIPSAFDLGSTLRNLVGSAKYSEKNLNKYLYKPINLTLYFLRKESLDDNSERINTSEINGTVEDISTTLKNWFEDNDFYLNGSHKIIVTEDHDYFIGTRVLLEITNGYFYCESVNHSFTYGGQITSDLLLTRGVGKSNENKRLRLRGRLFESGSE